MAILKKPFLCIGKTGVWPFLQCVCPGPGSSFRPGAAETGNPVFGGGQICFQSNNGNTLYCDLLVRVYVGSTTVPSKERNLLYKNGLVVTFDNRLMFKFVQTNFKREQRCNVCQGRVKFQQVDANFQSNFKT